jgi:homoserine O-succinyltransferase/O-acetyltransferase
MPLMMDDSRTPPRWAEQRNGHHANARDTSKMYSESLRLALINNMPDAALEDTEMQFFDLLGSAAGDLPVHIELYSLPHVPRSDRGLQHLSSFYSGIDGLLNKHFDGVIMTGTEPRQSNLREEPYWPALAEVLDWAETNTASTVLSCLAAHAGVLHSDGISRNPLPDKQFGLFSYEKICDHALTKNTPEIIRIPHSRWNEVRAQDLESCGYTLLTKSFGAGVDLFVKEKKKSLFLHFQGHPEYGTRTLLKEYRRDIRRFLTKERETYPTMPFGYFNAEAAQLLNEFQQQAVAHGHADLMASFPDTAVGESLQPVWQLTAACLYRNWLQYLASRKTDTRSSGSLACAERR